MQFYLAPMEAVTGYVYRNVYHSMFGDADKYFAPFLSPTQKKILKTRERKDVAPEHNVGMYMVPQILTNKSEQFTETCEFLFPLGYREVNLNLGCPAPTVVTKGKGSGFLGTPVALERFFDEIFEWNAARTARERFEISVKTRIGLTDPEEFEELFQIYNKFPLKEIIVHPRVRTDFYKGSPNLDIFERILECCKAPICYNGDICTVDDYEKLTERFPQIDKIMIGRGLVGNPGLIREIKTGKKIAKEEIVQYHNELYAGYLADLGAEKDVLFKMKELWFYLAVHFEHCDEIRKSIQKSKTPEEYKTMVKKVWSMAELYK